MRKDKLKTLEHCNNYDIIEKDQENFSSLTYFIGKVKNGSA